MTGAIGSLIATWARVYGDKKALSAGVTYVHLAGILLGGGVAIATDGDSLGLGGAQGPDLAARLARIRSVHRLVLTGLAITVASGLLMLFADLHTYLTSLLYWTKMALVALLLTNGWVRQRAETTLIAGGDGWRTFRATSRFSLVLWFAVLLAGAFLSTIS